MKTHSDNVRQPYAKPTLTAYGSIAALTLGASGRGTDGSPVKSKSKVR